MTRLFLFAMRILILGGLFVTSLGFDPIAQQVFREPKMLAMVWIGGFLLVCWGMMGGESLFRRTTPPPPPLPLLALVPLGLALLLSWRGTYLSPATDLGTPVQISYQAHVLLPVLAWMVVFACSSFLFGGAQNLRQLGFCVFLAMAFQTAVVLAEIMENRTGIRSNPVGWLGTLEAGTGPMKQRLFGTIGNPNFVAGYLAVAGMASVGWAIGLNRNRARILCGAVLSCALLGLVVTRSKGALLALALGLAHWFIAVRLLRRNQAMAQPRPLSQKWVAAVVLLVVAAGVVGLLLAESTSDPREGSYLGRWTETLALRGDSIGVRSLLAWCGFDLWEEKPWVGWGPGGFKVNFLDRLKSLLESPEGEHFTRRVARLHSLRASHLHNEYLQILVEWGSLGFAFVVLFLVACQTAAFRELGEADSTELRFLRLGLLSAFWCGLGGSLFDMPFHRPEQAYLLAVVLGASLARPKKRSFGVPVPSWRRSVASGIVLLLFLPLGLYVMKQASGKYIAQRNVFVARRILEGAAPGADPARVEAALRRAGELSPGEGDYDYLLALFHLEVKRDPAAAITRLRRARHTCDDPGRYLLEARAQIERNNLTTVGPILAFVEAIDPDSPGLHYLKGQFFQSRKHWAEACSAYYEEIANAQASGFQNTPHLAHCYFRLADILERELGQYSQAALYYKKLLELQAGSKQGYPAAQMRLAELYRDRFFDLSRAESYYREALEVFQFQGRSAEVEAVRSKIAEIERRRAEFRTLSQR